MEIRFHLLLFVWTLIQFGCGLKPKTTFEEMVDAARQQDVSRFRNCFTQLSQRLYRESGDNWRPLMKGLLGGKKDRPKFLGSESEHDGKVKTTVSVGGEEQELVFVKERGEWKLSLPDSPSVIDAMRQEEKSKSEARKLKSQPKKSPRKDPDDDDWDKDAPPTEKVGDPGKRLKDIEDDWEDF